MQGFPLTPATMHDAGLRLDQINRLETLIENHVAEGRYPGAQVAIARHGKLVLNRSFGYASPARATIAHSDTLWLLYSNTKVIVATTLWVLAEQGAFAFTDRIADHVPEFAANGKQDITVIDVITHQAGFPNAEVSAEAMADHARLRAEVCAFTLEWSPRSRIHYHPGAAHWVLAVLIEAVTGRDFRHVIRERVIDPLGLGSEMFVGLPIDEFDRAADIHEPVEGGHAVIEAHNSQAWRLAGVPGGGGYATARSMAALYQMMLAGGVLGGIRLLGPRMLAYAIRDWTGDRVDGYMKMPMHRGLGPHLRGDQPTIRGLGCIAHPRVFGHGGVGSSYCWADPESGVSFAYLSNSRIPEPWHSTRMDAISTIVHAAII